MSSFFGAIPVVNADCFGDLPVIKNPPELGFLNVNEAFDPTNVNQIWVTKAPMPTYRAHFAISEAGRSIYVFGGEGGDNVPNSGFKLSTVEAYNPVTNQWTQKLSMPTALYQASAATIGNTIYVVGGVTGLPPQGNGTTVATIAAYDSVNNIWNTSPLRSMSGPRSDTGIGVWNNKLYVFGGTNDSGAVIREVEEYNPATDMWTFKASMPTARISPVVAEVGGILYVIGGMTNVGLSVVEAYNPATDTWLTGPFQSMPTPRASGAAIGVINNIVYVVGGFDSNNNNAVVEAYDPSANSWSTGPAMLTGRAGFGAAVVNNVLYAVGGTVNFFAAVGQHFIYQIIAIEPSPVDGPIVYSASSLPPGLSIDGPTGIIYGVPTTIYDNIATITATNACGHRSKGFRFSVVPAQPPGPAIISNNCASGRTNHQFSFQVLAQNVSSSAVFTAGGLPPGLTINPVTGLISGTPTADSIFIGTVAVVDGPARMQEFMELNIISDSAFPIITSNESAALVPGQFFSHTLTADASATFSLIGTLPSGLSFDPVTHIISGVYTGGSQFSGAQIQSDLNLSKGPDALEQVWRRLAGIKERRTNSAITIPKPLVVKKEPPVIGIIQPVANNLNGAGTHPLNFSTLKFGSFSKLPNGHVLIQFAGVPNKNHDVESSTDLVNYNYVTTLTADADGHFDVEAPTPGVFYRIRYPSSVNPNGPIKKVAAVKNTPRR